MTTRRSLPFPELAGHVAVASESVADRSPTDAGRGLIVEDLDLEALVRDDPRLERVAVRAELGVAVEEHLGRPSVFVLSAPVPLSIVRGPEGALVEHDGTVVVDRVRLDQPALLRDRDRFLVLDRRDMTLEFVCFTPDPDPPAPAALTSPVASWIAGDAWLTDVVGARVATGDAYDHVVAVGLAWRLVRRDRDAERERVARLLAGRPAPEDTRERTWAHGVSPEAWRWIEQRALRDVVALRERLDALLDDAAPERVRTACVQRDGLEGVALALQAGRAGADLEGALDEVDLLGSSTLGALPPVKLDDEQLRRAAALDPEAWWVLPAASVGRE